MTIENHWLVGANQKYSVHTFGTLVPSYVVMHFTLGGGVKGSVETLNANRYGYNVIIDRDGEVYQTAAFNRIVRHAGASNWRGWDNLNGFSVGVCFANYGPCYKSGGNIVNEYKGVMDPNDVEAGDHYNGEARYQKIYWEKYTAAQLSSAQSVVTDLVSTYQIRDVIRHDDVAIGRKYDTGPALDLAPFHQLVGDRESEKIHKFRVVVPEGDRLNLRASHSATSKKLKSFKNGHELYVHSRSYRYYNGKPVKSKWCAVSENGLDRIGFVSLDYLEAVGTFV